MRLLVDGFMARGSAGGIGQYTLASVQALSSQGVKVTVAVPDYLASATPLTFLSDFADIHIERTAPGTLSDLALRRHWEQVALVSVLTRLAPDALFSPCFATPSDWPGPKVVAFHDVFFQRNDSRFIGPNAPHYRHWAKRSALSADVIVSVSAATASSIALEWGVRRPVRVVAPISTLQPPTTSVAESQSITRKVFGLRSPYILYTGGAGARKNVDVLISAFTQMNGKIHLAMCLHEIPGNIPPIPTPIAERMHLLGHCEARFLPHLYRASLVTVYPSQEEGYGLPPVESLECGTPVLTTPVPSIKGKGFLGVTIVPPGDAVALRDALATVAAAPPERVDVRQLGLPTIDSFGRGLLKAVHEAILINRTRLPRGMLSRGPDATRHDRSKGGRSN